MTKPLSPEAVTKPDKQTGISARLLIRRLISHSPEQHPHFMENANDEQSHLKVCSI